MGSGINDSAAGASEGAPEADGAEARIGLVVDDKYTIVRLLGKGGMGAVYEARHARLARRFAIKFLLPELSANREVLKRFENEAKAAGGLEHPNLAAVTDVGRAPDGSPYLVMEFLQGEDCAHLLRRAGPLPVARATNLIVQACRGLAVAHQAGIVHRDLKPENLFVTDAGDGSDLVKVLDFGIAKLRASETSLATGSGATFGTAFYMSPEQARGAADVDQRTDVWSLGVVLYELLGGRKPFDGEQFLYVIQEILNSTPPSLRLNRPDLPAKLIASVERAMSRQLSDRWPTVAAFAEAIAPFAGGSARVPAAVPAASLVTMSPATGMSKTVLLEESRTVDDPDELALPLRTGFFAKLGSVRSAMLVGTALIVFAAVLYLWLEPARGRRRQRGRVAEEGTTRVDVPMAPVTAPAVPLPPPASEPVSPSPGIEREPVHARALESRSDSMQVDRPARPRRRSTPVPAERKVPQEQPTVVGVPGIAPPPAGTAPSPAKKPALVF
jgi:serine/threonine-protein kinase